MNTTFFHERIGKNIIKTFRKSPSKESLNRGNDVTFLEFIQYLLTPKESLRWYERQSLNEHWEPINGICSPCSLSYDYIGKYENIVKESNSILNLIGVRELEFPPTEKVHPADTKSKIKDYYKDIPKELIQRLLEVYKMDLELFNYTIEEFISWLN